jgi:signal transduction histidine kinase
MNPPSLPFKEADRGTPRPGVGAVPDDVHAVPHAVPFSRVAKFVRQLMHDFRNGLSAIELEAATIAEIAREENASPELEQEVRRLRGMVSETAHALRELSLDFQPVSLHPISWPVSLAAEAFKERFEQQFAEEIAQGMLSISSYEGGAEDATVSIDLEKLADAVKQVLGNVFQIAPQPKASLSWRTEGAMWVIELCESKAGWESQTPPERWGLEPFVSSRPGGYGLGLYRTRQILEAHGGNFECGYFQTDCNDGVLITRMAVPICFE